MDWTTKRVTTGSAELKSVVALVLGGYLPGGIAVDKKKEEKKDDTND